MNKADNGESSNIVQECSEYEPIQAAQNLAMEYEEKEVEDAGCDSCAHSNNGDCTIYKREKY